MSKDKAKWMDTVSFEHGEEKVRRKRFLKTAQRDKKADGRKGKVRRIREIADIKKNKGK